MKAIIYSIEDSHEIGVLKGSKESVYDRLAQVVASSDIDLIVTDEFDNFVLSTFCSFLDRIKPEIREEFMEYLLPYQMGGKEVSEIKFDKEDE